MKQRLVLAALMSFSLVAPLVVAQPTPPGPPSSPGPPGTSGSPSPTPSASASPGNVEEGRIHHNRGVELSKQKNYRAALIEFQRAYAAAPNYRILFNLGQTSLELQDYAAAQQAFERYLAEGGSEVPADKRSTAESSLQKLKAWIAHVNVVVNVKGAEILVDDVVVGTSPLAKPLVVSAGRRRISAVKSGVPTVFRAIDVAGGDTIEVRLEVIDPSQAGPRPTATLAPTTTAPPPAPPPRNDALWYGVAATSGLALGALTTGLLALRDHGVVNDRLNTFPSARPAIDSARRGTKVLAITTDVLGGAALISGGITLYFAFRTPPVQTGSTPSSSPSQTARAMPSTTSQPMLGLQFAPSNVSLLGHF